MKRIPIQQIIVNSKEINISKAQCTMTSHDRWPTSSSTQNYRDEILIWGEVWNVIHVNPFLAHIKILGQTLREWGWGWREYSDIGKSVSCVKTIMYLDFTTIYLECFELPNNLCVSNISPCFSLFSDFIGSIASTEPSCITKVERGRIWGICYLMYPTLSLASMKNNAYIIHFMFHKQL